MKSAASFLDCLAIIWNPAVEALKLQQDLNAHSLEDIPAAAEQAGYEVCYADLLPQKVGGFAEVIGGKPFIVGEPSKASTTSALHHCP